MRKKRNSSEEASWRRLLRCSWMLVWIYIIELTVAVLWLTNAIENEDSDPEEVVVRIIHTKLHATEM